MPNIITSNEKYKHTKNHILKKIKEYYEVKKDQEKQKRLYLLFVNRYEEVESNLKKELKSQNYFDSTTIQDIVKRLNRFGIDGVYFDPEGTFQNLLGKKIAPNIESHLEVRFGILFKEVLLSLTKYGAQNEFNFEIIVGVNIQADRIDFIRVKMNTEINKVKQMKSTQY